MFLLCILLEAYASMTRAELNVMQAVCRKWKEAIRREGHRLACCSDWNLRIECPDALYNAKGFRVGDCNTQYWQLLPQFSNCCSHIRPIAKQLTGLLVILAQSPQSTVKFTLNLQKPIWNPWTNALIAIRIPRKNPSFSLCIRNSLTEDTSFALIHFFAHLQGKCLSSFNVLFQSADLNPSFNPRFFTALNELTGMPYNLRYRSLGQETLHNEMLLNSLERNFCFSKCQINTVNLMQRNCLDFITTRRTLCREVVHELPYDPVMKIDQVLQHFTQGEVDLSRTVPTIVFNYILYTEDWPATLTPLENAERIAEELVPSVYIVPPSADDEDVQKGPMPRKVRRKWDTHLFHLENVHSGAKFTATAKGFNIFGVGRKINYLELNFP